MSEAPLKFSHNDSLTDKNPFSKQDRPLLLDKVTAGLIQAYSFFQNNSIALVIGYSYALQLKSPVAA